METEAKYNSFNIDKGIDELLFNINQYEIKLKILKNELQFLKFLIEANIFKPEVINLFETLNIYDKKINISIIEIEELLSEIITHKNIILNKIECDNLECDAFFIKTQDNIEFKIYHFIANTNDLKLQVFQYLKSTIKNI